MTQAKNHGGISPAMVQHFTAGIHYPAKRDALIAQARSNGAPENVIEVIKELPFDEYGGPQDVLKAYSRLDEVE